MLLYLGPKTLLWSLGPWGLLVVEKKLEAIITLGSGLWASSCEVARGADLTFRVFSES